MYQCGQVLIATGEGNVVLLTVADGSLQEAAHVKLDEEVACLDISPLEDGAESASMCVVGTWRQQLRLYALPSMTPLTEVSPHCRAIWPPSFPAGTFEYLLSSSCHTTVS